MSKKADIPTNTIICGDWIKVAKGLPAGCVHTIITSPPYWGQRNYGVDGQLGLEQTLEEHIEKLVMGFRELRRILRDDGILWLNYGDKYVGGGCGGGGKQDTNVGSLGSITGRGLSLDSGNLIGLAWRLALALQADGWILRSDVIWAKAISSFGQHTCPSCGKELYQCLEQGDDLFGDELPDEIVSHKKSGSTMPESVNGTRWERCRVKVKSRYNKDNPHPSIVDGVVHSRATDNFGSAEYKDCPGCPKCEGNDGLVLRRGSWRPTRAHEYLFQLVKQVPYYADMEAVKEDVSGNAHSQGTKLSPPIEYAGIGHIGWSQGTSELLSKRNIRDVWTINPQSYKKAHYATFPEKLVEPCIKVSTSQKGVCPKCRSQWARIVDSQQIKRERPADRTDRHNQEGMNSCGNTVAGVKSTTLGWKPTCACGCPETVPAVVYDPFMGSGTVAAVAARMGRNYIGSELSEDYLENQAKFRISAAETGLSSDEIESGQMAMFEKLEAGATDRKSEE